MADKTKLPAEYAGHTEDLPETATTMWKEKAHLCPNNSFHEIVGSGKKYYCFGCGCYWDRSEINKQVEN